MAESKAKNKVKKLLGSRSGRMILYAGVLLLAFIYIFGLSDSGFRRHKKLSNNIKQLENAIQEQKKHLDETTVYGKIHEDPEEMEKYRREELNLKKEQEDVFIIE